MRVCERRQREGEARADVRAHDDLETANSGDVSNTVKHGVRIHAPLTSKPGFGAHYQLKVSISRRDAAGTSFRVALQDRALHLCKRQSGLGSHPRTSRAPIPEQLCAFPPRPPASQHQAIVAVKMRGFELRTISASSDRCRGALGRAYGAKISAGTKRGRRFHTVRQVRARFDARDAS